MNETLKMLLVSLLVGSLLVATILTFYALGVGHIVPWLLVLVLALIPVYYSMREKKHFVTWKDEYSVGIDTLDDDHKKLLSLINKAQTTVHYKTGKAFQKEALDELIDYTKYHFQREEEMMAAADYPDIEAHKQQHRDMIARVEQFMSEFDERGYETFEDVSQFLKNWLINHINGTDQQYSVVLQQNLRGKSE